MTVAAARPLLWIGMLSDARGEERSRIFRHKPPMGHYLCGRRGGGGGVGGTGATSIHMDSEQTYLQLTHESPSKEWLRALDFTIRFREHLSQFCLPDYIDFYQHNYSLIYDIKKSSSQLCCFDKYYAQQMKMAQAENRVLATQAKKLLKKHQTEKKKREKQSPRSSGGKQISFHDSEPQDVGEELRACISKQLVRDLCQLLDHGITFLGLEYSNLLFNVAERTLVYYNFTHLGYAPSTTNMSTFLHHSSAMLKAMSCSTTTAAAMPFTAETETVYLIGLLLWKFAHPEVALSSLDNTTLAFEFERDMKDRIVDPKLYNIIFECLQPDSQCRCPIDNLNETICFMVDSFSVRPKPTKRISIPAAKDMAVAAAVAVTAAAAEPTAFVPTTPPQQQLFNPLDNADDDPMPLLNNDLLARALEESCCDIMGGNSRAEDEALAAMDAAGELAPLPMPLLLPRPPIPDFDVEQLKKEILKSLLGELRPEKRKRGHPKSRREAVEKRERLPPPARRKPEGDAGHGAAVDGREIPLGRFLA